jgi:DNA-binding NarL/FixJ family response regulator
MHLLIQLLIVDDHEIIREGFKHMILEKVKERNFRVLEAGSIEEAKEIISREIPDIILVDYKLKDGTGNVLIKWLSDIKLRIPTIAFSNYAESSCIDKMRSAGARGYILKDIESNELVYAIEKVMKGEEYYPAHLKNVTSTNVSKHLLDEMGITKREHEILKLMMEQLTTDEISKQLYLSKRTVETHRYHLLKKFNVKNSLSLIKTVLTKEF